MRRRQWTASPAPMDEVVLTGFRSNGASVFTAAYGRDGIERVVEGDRSVEADIVIVAVRRTPEVTLAAMAECELVFDATDQAWTVRRRPTLCDVGGGNLGGW